MVTAQSAGAGQGSVFIVRLAFPATDRAGLTLSGWTRAAAT
jgi:hypothetical protein